MPKIKVLNDSEFEAYRLKAAQKFAVQKEAVRQWCVDFSKHVEALPAEIKAQLPTLPTPLTPETLIPALFNAEDGTQDQVALDAQMESLVKWVNRANSLCLQLEKSQEVQQCLSQ